MSDNAISSTTQEFLDVYDITNNMTILKDGTVSLILRIGTMNFSLLAEQEQDAIIYTYGALLNSLNYPVQINIQSQTKDATKYLRLLDEQTQKASSVNKANLIKKYRNFVSQLIRERNVLEKKFFMVIPASPTEMGLIAPKNVLPGNTTFDIRSVEKTVLLEKAANILEPRRDHLISQCNRLGLFAEQLTTQEIIQNFYINYNPEAQEGQEITNSESYKTPLVRASFSRNPMQDMNANAQTTVATTSPNNNIDPTNQQNNEQIAQNMPVAGQVLSPEPNLVDNPATVSTDASISETPEINSTTTQTANNLETNNNLPMPNVPPVVETADTNTPATTENTETNPMQNNPTIDLNLNQGTQENTSPIADVQSTTLGSNLEQNLIPNNPVNPVENTNTEIPNVNTTIGNGQEMTKPSPTVNPINNNEETLAQTENTEIETTAVNPINTTEATANTVVNNPTNQTTEEVSFAEEITPMQGSINTSDNNIK